MGIDFRGKGYVRRVSIGKRTIKEGEAVALWDQNGEHRQVIGPALLRLWYSTIRFLDKKVAGKDEYLSAHHADGTVEHIRGPTMLFENPVLHQSVTVEQAIILGSASQFVVVHREGVAQGFQVPGGSQGNQAVKKGFPVAVAGVVAIPASSAEEQRRVIDLDARPDEETLPASAASAASSAGPLPAPAVSVAPSSGRQATQLIVAGPVVFFPEAHDKVHVFQWAAAEADLSKRVIGKPEMRDMGIVSQRGLALDISYKMTSEVTCDVAGSDGYGATAQMLVQFQLLGVSEVLAVADPVAECARVVRASLSDEAAKLKFHDSAKPLAPALRGVVASKVFVDRLRSSLQAAAAIRMISISLAGVTPGKDLEKVLRQEDELAAARVAEQKADAALEAAHARAEREHALEAAKQKHALELEAERNVAAASKMDAESKQALAFLKELKNVGADVTKYLEAQATREKMPPGMVAAAQGAKAAGGSWW